jgi:hypothetical protein
MVYYPQTVVVVYSGITNKNSLCFCGLSGVCTISFCCCHVTDIDDAVGLWRVVAVVVPGTGRQNVADESQKIMVPP